MFSLSTLCALGSLSRSVDSLLCVCAYLFFGTWFCLLFCSSFDYGSESQFLVNTVIYVAVILFVTTCLISSSGLPSFEMAKSDYSEELEYNIEHVHRDPLVESRIIETEAMQDPNMRISDPLTVTETEPPSRVIGASPDEAGRALQYACRRP